MDSSRGTMTLSQALSRYYAYFACGDAVGKATEFMTLRDIRMEIGSVTGLVDPKFSITHGDMPAWAVTDDTEQNLWLLRRYLKDGEVTISNTVDELLKWIEATDAVKKHYIGPSSLRALEGIKKGEDPLKAGINGTTCGGIMRVPCAVFASLLLEKDLDACIYNALVCTHNNSVAMESAYGYAYALRLAINNALEDRPEATTDKALLEAARAGCKVGISKAPWESSSATLSARLALLESLDIKLWFENRLKEFLYGVLGTGLPSYETSGAVFGFNLFTDNPLKIMFMAAECGGDTDTIGALACSLSSMRNLEVRIPYEIIRPVVENNDLSDFIKE